MTPRPVVAGDGSVVSKFDIEVFMGIEPDDVARQLTLLDFEIFEVGGGWDGVRCLKGGGCLRRWVLK